LRPTRGIHEDDKKKKVESKQAGGEARVNSGDETEGCGDETSAYKVSPKEVPGNPRRNQLRDGGGQREMFRAEGREGSCVKQRTEEKELVEAGRFLPIAAEKNDEQADGKNDGTDGRRPKDFMGNRDEEDEG